LRLRDGRRCGSRSRKRRRVGNGGTRRAAVDVPWLLAAACFALTLANTIVFSFTVR
jgi:hypothetical protein